MKSDRSRLNAVADISRWWRTSQDTVSVSQALRPNRGQSFIATSAPNSEWSPPRPLSASPTQNLAMAASFQVKMAVCSRLMAEKPRA